MVMPPTIKMACPVKNQTGRCQKKMMSRREDPA